MDQWSKLDPIDNFERFLLDNSIVTKIEVKKIRKKIKDRINVAWNAAESEPNIESSIEDELFDIYKKHIPEIIPSSASKTDRRLVDAISDALRESMRRHDNLVIMGQDVAEYGGVFKITDGFSDEFGKHRVRNTPICESAIISAALGLSINGQKAVVEMQFADFVTSGFNAIVNNLAKTHYRWGENVDVVVRMPTGAGVGAGPFHSQSNEAWFTHTPGLKVVYPSFPEDAKGLLISSINDPNPVMFFEHKALYRSLSEPVSDNYFTTQIGKARLIQEGVDISIISYGMGVHWAINFLEKNQDVSADLIDLRTLVPLDRNTIFSSVKKTGKAIVLHEDSMIGGFGADIASIISDECFEYLDAPVRRSASIDTPIPFSSELEDEFLAKSRFASELRSLLEY